MKKTISCRISALILAVAAIALLVVGIYGLTRPMSYGAGYYHASFYDDEDFNSTMTFYGDDTMVIRNTNFNEDLQSYYYYKDGYIFFALSTTVEEYQEEVAAINEDFEGAVNAPFYASKINAFKMTSEGPDGYKSIYLCRNSIMMAVGLSVIELVLICFATSSVLRCKKKNEKSKQ